MKRLNVTLKEFNDYVENNDIDNDDLSKLFQGCDAGEVIFYLSERWERENIKNFIDEYGFLHTNKIFSDIVKDFNEIN